jgi:C4-dicarboxylate-specific signal transduction histidine kinase
MEHVAILEKILLDNFRSSTIGRLTKGIVHNINGPIQILSMQLELFKREIDKEKEERKTGASPTPPPKDAEDRINKILERIAQMEEVLARIVSMVDLIASRSEDVADGIRPIAVGHLLEEEIAFWKGDLFYKHQVKTALNVSSNALVVMSNEGILKDLVDAMLGACIEQLRPAKNRELKVTARQEEQGAWYLAMEQTGTPFPADADWSLVAEPSDAVKEDSHRIPSPHLILALFMAKARARQLNGRLTVEPQRISCRIEA